MKIIDKYLDKYYTRKLMRILSGYLTMDYHINYRVKNSGSKVTLETKPNFMDDRFYLPTYSVYPEEALAMMCDLDFVKKDLREKYKRIAKIQEGAWQ